MWASGVDDVVGQLDLDRVLVAYQHSRPVSTSVSPHTVRRIVNDSGIAHGVRLHGSDCRTYRASSVTAAWFVMHAPDFDTPVHGLEISQLLFRGGHDKSSPG